ncbi:MAG: 50S ribosomal protein L3 [Deltaproteobacteria bacterium]|nr:50S ribosomal protein L3 [Deltaproteobacteria bacterium]
MCKGMIGKKIGMVSYFTGSGECCPVTVIQLGPCIVTQVKNKESDGYQALQLGFREKKASRTNKPMAGHFKKSGNKPYAIVKEFAADNPSDYSCGQEIKADIFRVGERVAVSGFSKGRGFSGVIKRHGFSGGCKTHGSHSIRIPGSIGCSAWPAHVIKGKKMPGHYGVEKHTVKNLKVIDIRIEDNIMLLKGSVPGANSAYVTIHKQKFGK